MADTNGDGIVNLINFALRGDPHQDDSAEILPRMEQESSTGNLYFSFRIHATEGTISEDTGVYTVAGFSYSVVTPNLLDADEWTYKHLAEDNTELFEKADGPYLRVHFGNELTTGQKGFVRLLLSGS